MTQTHLRLVPPTPVDDTYAGLKIGWFPMLMFHRVVPEVPKGNPYNLCITPEDLERVILYLRRGGYEIVSLEDAIDAWQRGESLRRKACLTFDDGYEDFYTNASPVLRRQVCPATVFLVSNRLGGYNTWDADNGMPMVRLLSAAQVKELARDGISFGSHSATHRHLTQLSPAERQLELTGSKRALEDLLDRPVRTFAYPYLDQDASVQEDVRLAGYDAAVGGEQASQRPFLLHRIDLKHTGRLAMSYRLHGWHRRLHGFVGVRAAKSTVRGLTGRTVQA